MRYRIVCCGPYTTSSVSLDAVQDLRRRTSVAGGRAAARRPHPAAAVAIWRMLASHSGARRCANTHHGCTYCGCTVLGIASEPAGDKCANTTRFRWVAPLLISVVSILASLVSPLAISLCLLASA